MSFDFVENFQLFEELVEKLKNLHIDSAEFCCLKAIILFNPGKCFLGPYFFNILLPFTILG